MRCILYFFLFVVLSLSSCETKVEVGSKSNVIFHKTHEPKKESAPFSDIVQVGDIYFLSGQIGMDHGTRSLVNGGIEAETKQTLENIKAVLAQHDMDMSNVVKALVILDSIEDFSKFNAIYKTYLPQKTG